MEKELEDVEDAARIEELLESMAFIIAEDA